MDDGPLPGDQSGDDHRPAWVLYRALHEAWEKAQGKGLAFRVLARTDCDAVFEVKRKSGFGPRPASMFWIGVTDDGKVLSDGIPYEARRRVGDWAPAVPAARLRPGMVVPPGTVEVARYGDAWELGVGGEVAALCWGGREVLVPGAVWTLDWGDYGGLDDITIRADDNQLGRVTDRTRWTRRQPTGTITTGHEKLALWLPEGRDDTWVLASSGTTVATLDPDVTGADIEVAIATGLTGLVLAYQMTLEWEHRPGDSSGGPAGGLWVSGG